MRNPFKKTRYVENLKHQLLVQWTVILDIDRLIQASGASRYEKAEIVMLSQWAIFMAFAISKANHDDQQRRECIDHLKSEFDDLFIGLNNGVTAESVMIVPRYWISFDGDSRPARRLFNQNWDERMRRYTELFTSKIADRNSDPLTRVIDEEVFKILPVKSGAPVTLTMPLDILKSGLQKFISIEMGQIMQLLDK